VQSRPVVPINIKFNLKKNSLEPSEFILNEDGRIYHLNLKSSEIADTILLVGDPSRVKQISNHFETIEFKGQHREFITHTGTYKGKRLSVISTGIGTDNIDIVLNELDALVNIDFQFRKIKEKLTSLTIIRLGTSGAVQNNIPVDSFLMSTKAIGFDNLLHFYGNVSFLDSGFSEAFVKHTRWNRKNSVPYVVSADDSLVKLFSSEAVINGITATNSGFYGPQGRVLRLPLESSQLIDKIVSFEYKGEKISNFEMETSAIYGLARLLGHRALSLNAIIADRSHRTFSEEPLETIEKLIMHTLSVLTQ
jgi:uridine phosphorylase